MFMHESLCSCAKGAPVALNGREARRVSLGEVSFTAQGMRMLGQGMIAASLEYGLPMQMLKDAMKGNLFLVPPSSSLYFLFHVQELDADMHIEIPVEFWRFAQTDQTIRSDRLCA